MMTTPWQIATVGEFWQSFAWKESLLQSKETQSQQDEPKDWRQMDVQTFFSAMSWTGILKRSPSAIANKEESTFSYTLPVQEFLAHILWEGKPKIGALPQLSNVSSPPQELNLNDLSNLF